MQAARSLVSWQPVLTDHQAYTYQALAELAGVPMVAYVTTLEDSARKAQGWRDTGVTSIPRRVIPTRARLRYCFARLKKHREDVHFFGSPFQQTSLIACIFIAMLLRVEFYLVSEPYSPQSVGYLKDESSVLTRFKTWLRPLVYRAYVLCLRRRSAGIFAISRLAVSQYRNAGMPPAKIFPFGYFVPPALDGNTALPSGSSELNNALRLVFVGAFIQRKGIDVLVDALQVARRSGRHVQLDLYGPGELHLHIQNAEGVVVHAPIAFGAAGQIIAAYDFLVLPSHYDGWGVVVNEALAAGVPVVTSDATGAGVLAQEWGAGLTFRAGDTAALASVICELADNASLRDKLRNATKAAASLLRPQVAAQYMWDVISAPAGKKADVPAPWYIPHAH